MCISAPSWTASLLRQSRSCQPEGLCYPRFQGGLRRSRSPASCNQWNPAQHRIMSGYSQSRALASTAEVETPACPLEMGAVCRDLQWRWGTCMQLCRCKMSSLVTKLSTEQVMASLFPRYPQVAVSIRFPIRMSASPLYQMPICTCGQQTLGSACVVGFIL